jgi:glyoxylase-like metal-dependent hydrolase (beta-lactamase superfamily II)
VRAENPGFFTLDGTRTFIIGHTKVAVIDPGPDDPRHLERIAEAVREAESGWILLTHGHPDHSGGAHALVQTTGLPIGAPLAGANWHIRDGDEVPVDEGVLLAVATPGHARHHLAFHHRSVGLETGGDLYAGDLFLGLGRTTWVGEYSGCVADYLASLDRVERLAPTRILPAHGPNLDRPLEAVAAFRQHRQSRIEQVERIFAARGRVLDAGSEDEVWRLVELIVVEVYGGEIQGRALEAARWSVRAILEYLGVAPFPTDGAPSEGRGQRSLGS